MAVTISRGEACEAVHHRFKAMGSPCEIRIYTTASNAQVLLDKALARLAQLEQKYSRYQPHSVISQINSAAGCARAVSLDDETAKLFDFANLLHEQSDGLFDITSGILRKAWDFRQQRLPAQDDLDALLPLSGWHQVERTDTQIYLPHKQMEIDVGGFVKEYAADQVAMLLMDAGVTSGLVNLGGDLRVLGPHPDGSPWVIGIQHPRQAGVAIASIQLLEGAVATSGDYERFMMVDGVRYCHVLNPVTGWPVQSPYASVTTVSDQCVLSGAFSTIALLKAAQEPEWLAQSGVSYLCVSPALELSGNLPYHPVTC